MNAIVSSETKLIVQGRLVLAICASFALTAGIFTLLMRREISVYDESLILVGAERVMNGAVPYRDFYANYGPGSFYILALLFKVFGPSIIVERAFDITVRAATVLFCYQIIRLSMPRTLAWVTAALLIIWMGDMVPYSYPIWPCLLMSIATTLFAAYSIKSINSKKWMFIAGVSAGICVLFRFDVGFYVTVLLCIVVLIIQEISVHERITRLLYALAGVALVCIPVTLLLLIAGAMPDLIFDNISFPAKTYPIMRSLPFPKPHDLIDHPQQIAVYLPVVIVGWAYIILLISRKQEGNLELRKGLTRWLIFALATLSIFLYMKGLVRVSILHMAISFVTAVCLAVVITQILPRRGWHHRAATTLIGSLIVVCIFSAFLHDARTIRKNLAWVLNSATWRDPTSPSSCSPDVTLSRLRCFETDPTWAEMVATVYSVDPNGKVLFAGLPEHDRIVINDMLIYFATGRRPATKWYHFDPGLQTSRSIQASMISDLEHSQPSLIVLYDPWTDKPEPNGSALSSGILDLDIYIRSHFQLAKEIAPYRILTPKINNLKIRRIGVK